jgi:hypothetical protein
MRDTIMGEYSYQREQDLPPVVTSRVVLHIKSACQKDKAHLGRSAQRHLHKWKIHESQLRGAIIAHIEKKRRIFRKFDPNEDGEFLENNSHANVTLSLEEDVYVEMILMPHGRIIINAHEHDEKILRLLQ